MRPLKGLDPPATASGAFAQFELGKGTSKYIVAVVVLFFFGATLIGVANTYRNKETQDPTPRSSSHKLPTGAPSWNGTYSFVEDPGPNAGSGPIIAEHTIVIYNRGERLIADIDADGYQTTRRLRCDTMIAGNRITLHFNSSREDNSFTPYKKGQVLLVLERATARGRTRILTHWGAYRPVFRPLRNGRVYFKKTK